MIEVRDLSKRFGPIQAVTKISFDVNKGDVLGFLGPNGAGKTTTMRMLSGFLPPDGGTAKVLGHDIASDTIAVQRNLGYVAENAPCYDEMTPASFLKFVCDARGVGGQKRREAIDAIAETCAIAPVMHQQIGTLSKGYRRRVGLAQALVHDPPVLLLDEPTDGLDPNQKHGVRELIKRLASEKCIIISTHILEEVDAICNRIIIIDRGELLVDGTPEEIRKRERGSLDEIFRKITSKHKKITISGGAS